MADDNAAVDYVLGWEDPTLSGVITDDSGGRTRFGIAERFHPELTNCLFYTSMGANAALIIARSIYDKEYCQPLCISDIRSQAVANKLLSLGVNVGIGTAAKMLQIAVSVPGDGRIGPLTLSALDSADPNVVLSALRVEAENYYDEIIAEHPNYSIYRAGWMRRAEA